MKIRLCLIAVLCAAFVPGFAASARYLTYYNGYDQPLYPFFNEYSIHCLVTSSDGKIFGGTGGIGTEGRGILFYFNPVGWSAYNPSSSLDGYPRLMAEVPTKYSGFKNVKGISILKNGTVPDTVVFAADGPVAADSTLSYGIFYTKYSEMAEYYPDFWKVADSPNAMKYVDGFIEGPPRSGKNPLIFILTSNYSGYGKVEVFDPDTMSFIDTMTISVDTATGSRDYRFISGTNNGIDMFFGTLTIKGTGNFARIMKLDQNGVLTEEFQPSSFFFAGDDGAFTGISAMCSFHSSYPGVIVCGTLSSSTQFGGQIFYYDSNWPEMSSLLGPANGDTTAYSVTDLVILNGEIYGSTNAVVDPKNTSSYDRFGHGKIFKITLPDSGGSLLENTCVPDYRITDFYYNPAIINAITASPQTSNIYFGTILVYEGMVTHSLGGLIGAADFYPPSSPVIKRVEREGSDFRIYFSGSGDDGDTGEAEGYLLYGSIDPLPDSGSVFSEGVFIADSAEGYFQTDTFYFDRLYAFAVDDCGNRSPFHSSVADIAVSRLFPNPVRPGPGGVSIGASFTASEVKVFSSDGTLVISFIPDPDYDELTDLYYFCWDLKNPDGKNVAAGVYFISITDIYGSSRIEKLAVIK